LSILTIGNWGRRKNGSGFFLKRAGLMYKGIVQFDVFRDVITGFWFHIFFDLSLDFIYNNIV
jgi:hypothetical protein